MIDTDEYLTILKESLNPWMMKYYDSNKVMLVQDSAPANASQRVQDFLSQKILQGLILQACSYKYF